MGTQKEADQRRTHQHDGISLQDLMVRWGRPLSTVSKVVRAEAASRGKAIPRINYAMAIPKSWLPAIKKRLQATPERELGHTETLKEMATRTGIPRVDLLRALHLEELHRGPAPVKGRVYRLPSAWIEAVERRARR